jgi:hypothetical protein
MKTAVEWFNEEIKELFNQYQNEKISESMLHFNRLLALNQAKEMELDKLKEAYSMGRMGKSIKEFNETFKSEQ